MLMPFMFEIITLGLAIGVVLGATGAGGAILSVPLLTLGLHLTVSQAAPIGLFAVSLASSIAALIGLYEGIVRYKAAVLMAGMGVLLSPLGLWLAQRLPNAPLVMLFVIVLLFVAWRMWHSVGPNDLADESKTAQAPAQTLSQGLNQASTQSFACERSDTSGKFIWTLPCARALALTGGVAGFLSGLIGVGGGFIIVPSLKKNTNLDMRAIVATSLAVITLVSISGVVIAAHQGLMDWHTGLPFAAGTVAGTLAGRLLGKHLSSSIQARGFAMLAAAAAALMVIKLQ
ncbi:hypothetical protein DTO96_101212 [Ephemeroptericola cinctiostellae]|uniref:Probable membrane transporter protein n=2 Tax=Ephemeroptericola cinctiostellae TaxID=2268024 RepID=A0A345DAU3_9BURK|nr:hypothetical protein DTO96_101212 [Ephemeroptericola cinctiostellae]